MAAIVQKFTRLIRGPLFLWRRFQYASGLRPSRLVALRSFPKAPYRAIVFGLEEDMWDQFDAAYPEYEKRFAPPNVHLAELRAALTKRHMALLVFDRAPKRHVDTVTGGLNVTMFNASYAPIPALEKDGRQSVGFLIDTMGAWLGARRQTEIDIFLDSFNLDGRETLLADGAALHKNLQSTPSDAKCLVIANGNRPISGSATAEDNSDLIEAAHALPGSPEQVMFQAHLFEPWYSTEVINAFLTQLESCKSVVVRESPLGLIACLAGRQVTVTGRPFWAGYGLTTDLMSFQRRRTLSPEALAAIVVLLLSRYIDDTGQIIDPAQGWHLPTAQILPPVASTPGTATSVVLS